MRDRLIELINQRIDNKTWTVAELAEYLLANGVIVPPCKVGDTVYICAILSGQIVECTIIGFWLFDQQCTVITDSGTIHNDSFGKTVFLTKEEAEAKLKGDQ